MIPKTKKIIARVKKIFLGFFCYVVSIVVVIFGVKKLLNELSDDIANNNYLFFDALILAALFLILYLLIRFIIWAIKTLRER